MTKSAAPLSVRTPDTYPLSPSANFQRVGILVSLPAVLRRFDVDPTELLSAAGLDPQALDNPNATIPFAAMGLLLELAAEATRCPHIGLHITAGSGTASLGAVGELMRNAPTLGRALLDFAGHQHRNAHGSVVYLLTRQHEAFFGYAVYHPNVRGYQVICDAVAMTGLCLIRELLALANLEPGNNTALEVLLPRREPAHDADAATYRRSFGVKVRFNADQAALVLPRKLLDLPLPGADAALRKEIENTLRTLWYSGPLDPVTELRRVLRVALITGSTSADEIAAELGVSRRTLHRRLDSQGLQFQAALDEARRELSQQLLANTQLGAGEIGLIVGYEDQSVFTRAFSRWAGVNPTQWRRAVSV
jgi:AraC-like DNA-binding protein